MKKYILILIVVFSSTICNTREFNFVYTVEISSSNNNKLELWIPVPQSNEVQTISNLIIDTNGLDYIIKDEYVHGNKYAYIYSRYGTVNSKIITISFDVKRKEHKNIQYQGININNYLQPTSMVPVGGIFNKIIEKNNLNNKDIRSLYDFVLNGMHYAKPKSIEDKYYKEPWLSDNKKYGIKKVTRDDVVNLYKEAKSKNNYYTFGNGNSIYACDIGVGNCTDFHSYFISLSRTIQIPTRFHMGFQIPNKEDGEVEGYHCWADYYIDDAGWFPIDISEADKNPEKKDYFFGTLDNNRVDMMVGRDFILEEYKQKKVNYFIYPLLEINDKESDSFSQSFNFRNL